MKKVWVYWILSLLMAIICLAVNHYIFPVREIIKLEFSSSAAMMHTYIMSNDCLAESCYERLKFNTIADYGFIVSFSMLTLFSFKLFLDVFQINSKVWWVYVLSFITGLLDVVENYFLLKTALTQQEAFSCFFYWVVRIKWAFAIVPFLLVPIVLFYALVLLLRTKQTV
jgi:hypothetical protein